MNASRHPFLDHQGPIAFVHRGGAAEAAENSLAAFQRAFALGFRYAETDVHATADGVLVVSHDPTLDRVADRPGRISQLVWADVARARLSDGSPLPRLPELLEVIPGVRLNIDVKADEAVGPLARLLLGDRALLERVCVGSFSDARLTALRRRVGPRLCTSTGPAGVLAHLLAARLGRPTPLRYLGDCLQVPATVGALRLVTRGFVDAAHAQGRPVHVWTVDDPGEMGRLLDLGVDGIMTDQPTVLRAVLTDRGQWSDPT